VNINPPDRDMPSGSLYCTDKGEFVLPGAPLFRCTFPNSNLFASHRGSSKPLYSIRSHQPLQFGFGNCKFCEATIQTDQKLRKNPNHRLLQTSGPGKRREAREST